MIRKPFIFEINLSLSMLQAAVAKVRKPITKDIEDHQTTLLKRVTREHRTAMQISNYTCKNTYTDQLQKGYMLFYLKLISPFSTNTILL